MADAVHTIKAVSNMTGLSPHVIRIWERRYSAVAPARTGTKRRVYSEAEVEKLSLLQKLVSLGHSIRNIASFEIEALRELHRGHGGNGSERSSGRSTPVAETSFLDDAVLAVRQMNSVALDEVLVEASVALGHQGMLVKVVGPLAQEIGYLWETGELTAAHEHFASAAIKIFLGSVAKSFYPREDAPVLLIATPSGQLHSLGAVIVMACAANFGWKTIYLGASLPAEDIAGTARRQNVAAVALSIVYPEDDPAVGEELKRLRQFLPDLPILVGGRAASAYRKTVDAIHATEIQDLADLLKHLTVIHRPMRAADVNVEKN